MQHYVCERSACHSVLNVNDYDKDKIKIHLLKKEGFVITKIFPSPLNQKPSDLSTTDRDILVLNYANGNTKTQEFLLSFSICINHTYPV